MGQQTDRADLVVQRVLNALQERQDSQLQRVQGYAHLWRELIALLALVVAGSYYAANLESRTAALATSLDDHVASSVLVHAQLDKGLDDLEAELADLQDALDALRLESVQRSGDRFTNMDHRAWLSSTYTEDRRATRSTLDSLLARTVTLEQRIAVLQATLKAGD